MEGEKDNFAAEVFAGSSAAVERLRLQVARFAPHFRIMLLVGEPGVGKRAVARELHRLAGGGDFVELDARELLTPWKTAATTACVWGLARVPVEAQMDLLAAIDRLPRELRVIVGCEGEPRGMVAAGRLRAELYERVGTLEVRVSPLRERMEDLQAMAESMAARLGREVSEGDMEALQRHDWPGNVPELWRVCEGLAAGEGVRLEPAALRNGAEVRLDDVMRRHVMDILERCAGNKLRAAELLGISRSTLYRML